MSNTEIMIVAGIIICVLVGWLIGLYSEIHDLKQSKEEMWNYTNQKIAEIGVLKYQLNQSKIEKNCKHQKNCTFFEMRRDANGQKTT